MPDWILAIDFGTTSTAAAMRVADHVERIELDGSPRMPSMAFWHERTGTGATGRLVVGEEADQLSGLAPWCLERTPKRRIGDEYLRLGSKELRVVDVIGAILRKVAEEALSLRGGEPPREVRLTHPARWGSASLGKLRQAAEIAGLGSPVFVAEPVAAATHFASQRLQAGQYVAVYDLGGGTYDTAVLQRTEDSFVLAGAPGGNENLGGEDFDDRLYRYLGQQLSHEDWRQLQESEDRIWTQANTELRRSARRTKEFLSRAPRYEFYMPPPLNQELQVTAETLRELIVQDIQSTVVELERTVRDAGLDPNQLAAIYLAGGSSRIPLVSRTIQLQFGQTPESWDDPKAVTVLGAARLPSHGVAAPTVAATQPTQPRTRQYPLMTGPEPLPRQPGPPQPTPPQPGPSAGASPRSRRGLVAGLVGLGAVAVAGVAAGALAAAGVFSGNPSTTTVVNRTAPGTTTVVTQTVSTSGTTTNPPPPPPSSLTPCSGNSNVSVDATTTSCEFAINVYNGYTQQAQQSGAGDYQVSAFSPKTGQSYIDTCNYDSNRQVVTCSHGSDVIQFGYHG